MASRLTAASLFDPAILAGAARDAFVKLNPRHLARNPVIFVTEVVAAVVTALFLRELLTQTGDPMFSGQIAAWLWFTVLFANFAEAVAEGRGKAQAATLRGMRTDIIAKRIPAPGVVDDVFQRVPADELQVGDIVLVEAGELIPADGEVIAGIAMVNESAITGESAPVIREAGGDRSAVTGGTTVVSDRIKVKVTAASGSTFLDRMIALIEGAERQKTPNELALSILLSGMTLIFLIAVVTLWPLAGYSGTVLSITVLIALLVTLIPTTIGGLLSAIGIAGMDRLIRFNVLATSGRAVEAAGDVDTLLLDKTGTITFGNRQATEVIPVPGVTESDAAEAAMLASLADETAEGRSIVTLMQEKYRVAAMQKAPDTQLIEFSATTRLSGVNHKGRKLRKGAVDAVLKFAREDAGREVPEPAGFRAAVDRIARSGGTPLGLCDGGRILGVIHLKDVVKGDIKERFAELRSMGIRTVMVTGDNPVTAAAIASEAGVDDFIAEATPGGQASLHPRRAGEGPPDRDVRRRHQRRARAGAGRCRRRHADRHAAGARGRQHGRSRFRSDQAHRGGRDRQAASDDPRLVDDILDRQRCREVFCDHPGVVRRHLSRAAGAQRHAAGDAQQRDSVRGDLQRADHRRPDPARLEGRDLSPGRSLGAVAAEPADLRDRRNHRAVHRHQARRSRRHRPQACLRRLSCLPIFVLQSCFSG